METRTYDPEDDGGIGKLVRDALGETYRPFEPGDPARMRSAEEIAEDEERDEEEEPSAHDNPLTAAWPSWEDTDDDEGDSDADA